MARRRDVEAAIRAASLSESDQEQLADRFFRTKVRVYFATLRDLADRFTVGGKPEKFDLSEEIRSALRAEADRHAALVAKTHNDAIRKEALAISSPGDGRERADLERELSEFAAARMRKRAEPIAVTESYGPHTDAMVSFFLDAGVEPEFTFGGHVDDAPPACAICAAIIAANPHSMANVIRIGVPHPYCRQSWHPQISATELPFNVDLGNTPGGVVGRAMLIQEAGGAAEAAESVAALRG